jgi:hypothetical protein
VSGGSSDDDDGGNKVGNEGKSKPGLGEGGALLTRPTRDLTPVTTASQAVSTLLIMMSQLMYHLV